MIAKFKLNKLAVKGGKFRGFTTSSKCYELPKLSESLVVTSKAKDSSLFASHDLMLRAGLINQSSSGIYTTLPFGLRSLNKLKRIIEEELDSIGCQQIDMPNLSNSQKWKQTDRWNIMKDELIKLEDRKGTEFCLAPTHEEEVTHLIGELTHSYKNLPIKVYQIGKKFRDELRPRGGLLRGREFLMKDLYTFDTTKENAMKTYNLVQRAYKNIFNRIGVAYKICEADTGSIGGTLSNEFHYLSKAGEDKILSCLNCGYSANQEAAKGLIPASTGAEEVINDNIDANLFKPINQFNVKLTNEATITFIKLKEEPSKVYAIISKYDREINWLPVEKFIQHPYELINSDKLTNIKQENIHYLVDNYFKSGEVSSEQSTTDNTSYIHLHLTQSGDHCPKCASHNKQNIALEEFKAIEVGHTFYLGTKYSALLNSTFSSSEGKLTPFVMGCFGIGVSRLLPAVIESSHDSKGIIWPFSIAPYRVCIVPLIPKTNQPSDFTDVLNKLEQELNKIKGLKGEVILDDRYNLSIGSRLKDADLLGYPFVIVLGKSFAKEGKFEVQVRANGEKILLTMKELTKFLNNQVEFLSY